MQGVRFHFSNFFLLFLATITIPNTLLAERGRLADGRAYRVDQLGNELVDYTAELEVQLDALKRRVHVLENELQIARRDLSSNPESRGGDIAETDLLNTLPKVQRNNGSNIGDVGSAKMEAELEQQRAQLQSLQRELQNCTFARESETDGSRSCTGELAKLRGEMRQIRTEHQSEIMALRTRETELSGALPELKVEREQLARELSQLQARNSELEKEQASLVMSTKALRSQLDSERQLLSSKQAEIESLGQKNAILTAALEKSKSLQFAKAAEPSALGQREGDSTQRASLDSSPEQQLINNYQIRPVTVGVHGEHEEGVRESLRSDLLSKLETLKPLLRKRDDLFQKFNSRGTTLRLTPKASRSSFDLYGRQIPKSNFTQLRVYSREMVAFERALKEDLNTVQRLLR